MKRSHINGPGPVASAAALVLAAAVAAAQQTQPAEPAAAGGGVDAQLEALGAEIEALLLPTGLPVESNEPVQERLADVARRSGELARSEIGPQRKLRANVVELRAYNALANDATRAGRPEDEVQLRVMQMRSAAEQARQIPDDDARVSADFWLLNADLFDINRDAAADLVERQDAAIGRLEAFVARGAAADGASTAAALLGVRRALLRLYVQSGRSAEACALLEELGPENAADPEAEAICSRIGRPARAEYLEADSVAPATRPGPAVTLVRFSEPPQPPPPAVPPGARVVDHPVTADRIEALRPILDHFVVRSLPWYAVVARDGRITAIGQTEAIVRQIDPLLPVEPPRERATQQGSTDL